MSDILAKNLKFILEYNPNLCAKILSVSGLSKSIQLAQNENGEHNLVVDGVPVHSVVGAEAEAMCIAENLSHDFFGSIHVIYGLGLGYLCDTFVQKLKGNIVVYEPDIEVLRFVFEIVDFTDAFSSKRCFIVSDYTEYTNVFSNVFRYKSKTSMSALDYYFSNHSLSLNSFKEEVYRQYGLISHNYTFQVNSIYSFLQSTLDGLASKFKSKNLTDYKDVFKGKVAIVVSAGPSLSKNIEYLKKYRENVVIFCVGTALKTLLKNGIIPDFLHVIERSNTLVHIDFPQTEEINLVCAPYTNEAIFSKKYKNIFVTPSEETEVARWFLDIASRPVINFETKGTVAYNALFSAMFLGCKTIILIGQDLAYSDGSCYARGSAFENLKCVFDEDSQKYKIVVDDFESFRDAYYSWHPFSIEEKNQRIKQVIEKYSSELVTVDGQNGEKLPTSALYSLFIEYMQDFALRYNKDLVLINSSTGGALLKGFENLPLDDALGKYALEKIDRETFDISLNADNTASNAQIISNLKQEIKFVNDVLPLLKVGQESVVTFKKELSCRNSYTNSADRLLNKLADLYVEITNVYMSKSKLLGIAFMKERSEIAYLMKELGEQVTYKDALLFSDAFTEYYVNVYNRLLWCLDKLDVAIQELLLDESCYTKS